MFCFPLSTYTPLKCVTGPVSIGHSLTLLGFIPIGQSLALLGFGGSRVEQFDISVAPSHKLLRGTMVIRPVIMTHDHMGVDRERASLC
jgi:hypothetical protein